MDTPTAPIPTAPTPTAAPAPISPGSLPELSDSQSATVTAWIKEDLAKDELTPEQAAKAFDELNALAEARQPDTRSDDMKELDPPADKPEDYTIHYGQDMKPELKQFDTLARTWIHAAEFPRDLGTTLAKTIDDVTRMTQHMTEAQLEQFGVAEMA